MKNKFKIGDYVRLKNILYSRTLRISHIPSRYSSKIKSCDFDSGWGWANFKDIILVTKAEEFLCKIYEI